MPLHDSLNEMYLKNDIYTPLEVQNCVIELIKEGHVECLDPEELGRKKVIKVRNPNLDDFKIFSQYWFKKNSI